MKMDAIDTPLTPLLFVVGKWKGTGEAVDFSWEEDAEYTLELNGFFILEKSVAKSNGKAVHSDFGIFSYDEGRKLYVARWFNSEGTVELSYGSFTDDESQVSFLMESGENFPPGVLIRRIYKKISNDEFILRLEMAQRDEEFSNYVEGRYRRV